MKFLIVVLLSILGANTSSAQNSKIQRLPAGDNHITVDINKRIVNLSTPHGDFVKGVPYFGDQDEWLDSVVSTIGDKQYLQIKIWSTPQGTSSIQTALWWYIYEIGDNGFSKIAKIQVVSYTYEEKLKIKKIPKLTIKLLDGKLQYLINGKVTEFDVIFEAQK
ncbi:MAG: hypothetical protein SGI74_09705 [Oligoflexia bacterium]|nr:hypothetical protein [Oligoflexia bacterium]